jgi:carbamoyl-phosphate synthase large subunit
MMGASLAQLGAAEVHDTGFYAVKESVFPFAKFLGVDIVLGPEMRSTGEVMGADRDLPVAFAKALMGAGIRLPESGGVFLSVRESDKPATIDLARSLHAMGFGIICSAGTGDRLARHGIPSSIVAKIATGVRPNILDKMSNGEVALIINTPTRKGAHTDEGRIRAQAVRQGVPIVTTVAGARAAVQAIASVRSGTWDVRAIQDYFPHLARPALSAEAMLVR